MALLYRKYTILKRAGFLIFLRIIRFSAKDWGKYGSGKSAGFPRRRRHDKMREKRLIFWFWHVYNKKLLIKRPRRVA
jgi:hypothetical protein